MYKYALFILCSLSILSAQNQSSQQSKVPFATAFFEDRTPDFKPLRKILTHNIRTAIIPTEDTICFIEVVNGFDSLNVNNYWLLVHKPKKVDYLMSLSAFNDTGNSPKTVTKQIPLYADKNLEANLELRLIDTKSVILYRWIGSSQPNIVGGSPSKDTISHVFVGKPFPKLVVSSFSDNNIDLSSLKGKIIVINWWSTSCGPCVGEIPELNKLVDKYSKKNVTFIAITDDKKEVVINFLKKKSFKYEQTIAKDNAVSIFGAAYPRNVVIDKNGFVLYDHCGSSLNLATDLDKNIEMAINKNN